MWLTWCRQPDMCRRSKPLHSQYVKKILLSYFSVSFPLVRQPSPFHLLTMNNFSLQADSHTEVSNKCQHTCLILISFKVFLILFNPAWFPVGSEGLGKFTFMHRSGCFLFKRLWQNGTTIYISVNFTSLCNLAVFMSRIMSCIRCIRFKNILVLFFSHAVGVAFFEFNVCVCVFVFVCPPWLTGQPAGSCRCKEGFGGLRCDRWDTGAPTFTHMKRRRHNVTGERNLSAAACFRGSH